MSEDLDTSTAAAVGELLPRGARAFGVRRKLEKYALDITNEVGAPKACGFERILAITLDDIDYLEGAIYTGAVVVPVSEIRDNAPWGIKCTVIVPVRGRDEKSGRLVDVTTAWEIRSSDAPPRLVTAFPTS